MVARTMRVSGAITEKPSDERGQHELVEGGAERAPVHRHQGVDGQEPGDARRAASCPCRAGPAGAAPRRARRRRRRARAGPSRTSASRRRPTPTSRLTWSSQPSRRTAATTPSGMPDSERHQQRGQGQLERGGHALDQVLQHGPAGRVALAEVAARQAAQIAPVLDDHRLVEAHAPLHLRDVLRRGERPRLHQRGIARQDIRQHERDDASRRRASG